MEYGTGTELVKPQWDQTRAPGHVIGLFQKDRSGMINTSIHLALSPNGMLMDRFYLTENGKEKEIVVTLGVGAGHYTIDKIKYNNQSYEWDNNLKCFRNENSVITAKKDKTKPDKVNLFRYTGESCKYEYLQIAWDSNDESNRNTEQNIQNKITENSKWVLYPYTERDLSCDNNFIQEILARDRHECGLEEIASGDKLLRDNLGETNPEHLVNVVNSVCLSSLRKLTYQEKTGLFIKIAKQESIKESSELALLRIMNALYTTDYNGFYKLLEANNNELIKHLVGEMDDASIWFWTDKSNYTNFIGALVTMFNQSRESIADRWPAGEVDFTQRVINLNPIEYGKDVSSVFAQSYTDKYNNGEYDGNTGNITLYDVYKMTVYGGDLTLGQNSVSHESRREKLSEISPLTPIIIIPEKDKIPLIQAALDGYDFGNGAYIVPAIFLKYNADKIRNDYIEKGIVTALDVATIAAIGGTALATKVTWVRRAWAVMEVAGAVGDITVNVANTSPEMKPAIDAYNMAMGIIGVKNVGKGIVNFAKGLPANVKTLLQENKSIRSLIAARYLDYRIAITRLKNSDSWAELPAEIRQQVVQQEKTFIVIADTKNLPDNWGVSRNVFVNGKTSEDILTIPKGSRPMPETYLDAAYIQQHLNNFKIKASYLVTGDTYNKYIVPGSTIGRKDGLFISTTNDIDVLLKKANGNISIIERDLGIPIGNWQGKGGIYRIDIIDPEKFNLRIPCGNEGGANDLWLPGGNLPNGKLEAVIDPIPTSNIKAVKVIN
jgi:hypothetical protein